MIRFYNWYRSLNNFFQVVVIFSATILMVALVFAFTTFQMNSVVTKAMRPYADADQVVNRHFASLKKPAYLQDKYFEVFKAQQKIMDTRKAHHLRLSRIFFRNYYSVSVLLMLLSCIGGITLFVLINRGWAGAGHELRGFFLALVFCVTFFGFFPLVFKQEQNLQDNMKYFMDYTKAETTMLDQLSRLENPLFGTRFIFDSNSKKEVQVPDSATFYYRLDSMIAYNNSRINELTGYVLSMDINKVKSIADVYRMVSNFQSGNLDSVINR